MSVDHLLPAEFSQAFARLPPAPRYWIAYSGGLDSHVLLHALSAARESLCGAELCAIHVDHGLSPHAADWSRHCLAVCAALGVPCTVKQVDARPAAGESREAAARAARYRAFGEIVGPGEGLLTAHQRDDQAETVLLQLLRGAGPHGLAAMPEVAQFAQGWVGRPLLGISRAELRDYAGANGLRWIEDESNFDTGFDRNYLRHEIMPRLRARWPAVDRTVARSAGLNADAAGLLDQLAELDLAGLRDPATNILSVSAVLSLDDARRLNAVRAWLRRLGLPLPNAARLRRLEPDILRAAPDAMPCLDWPGAELRRYRDRLYAGPPLPGHDSSIVAPWDLAKPLTLSGVGRLQAEPVAGDGLSTDRLRGQPLTVRFRRGGERCRPAGRGQAHELKKLFQERGVPPWVRDRVPLIYVGDALAEVVGHWRCEPFAAGPGEDGWAIALEPGAGAIDHQ